MRDRWIYDVLPESERAVTEAIDANPAWRHGEISIFTAELCVEGMLFQHNVSPIGDTGLCMSISAMVPPPKDFTKNDLELTFKSYDELCD